MYTSTYGIVAAAKGKAALSAAFPFAVKPILLVDKPVSQCTL